MVNTGTLLFNCCVTEPALYRLGQAVEACAGMDVRRFVVCTERGVIGEDESAQIVAAGAASIVRLGWAIVSILVDGRVHVALHSEAIMPDVARELVRWLEAEVTCRVTVDPGGPIDGGTIEFLDVRAATEWVRRLAESAGRNPPAGWVRALAATWLNQDGRHVASLADLLVRRADPDTAAFALHTMGCIALRWAPRPVAPAGDGIVAFDSGRSWKGLTGVPACVMVDPRSLRKAPLATLATLATKVSSFPHHAINLEWFDGEAWNIESQTGEAIADRIERLRRMFQGSAKEQGLQAVDADLGNLARLATRHPDANAALEIVSGWRALGGAGLALDDVVERWPALVVGAGVRAKLMRVNDDGGMTFLRYNAGPRNFYDRSGDDRVLAGRTLECVPNARLADQIVHTARRMRREPDALLERVSGRSWTIFEGPIRIDYWRLSVPIGAAGRRMQGALMMTCGFEVTRLET